MAERLRTMLAVMYMSASQGMAGEVPPKKAAMPCSRYCAGGRDVAKERVMGRRASVATNCATEPKAETTITSRFAS